MTKDEIQELAKQAVGAGEPVAWVYDWYTDDGKGQSEEVTGWMSTDYDESHSSSIGCHNIRPLYTAEQVAAAVAAERERCSSDATAAIRNRSTT